MPKEETILAKIVVYKDDSGKIIGCKDQTIQEIKTPSPCCDQCDQIDGDYNEEMKYNFETFLFECRRGHGEDFEQAMRTETESSLYDIVKSILEA